MAAESGRQALDTQWQPSACGDKPAKLDVFDHHLINGLEQVGKEIRQILSTHRLPSACGDEPSRLKALYHDLIKCLAWVENEISKEIDKLRETSTYGADPSSLGEFCLDLINSLEPVKNKIRKEFDKLRETSTYGADSQRLWELCLYLINSLDQVKNKIRQILSTHRLPSACGDEPSRLKALYHDLIKCLAWVENEISKEIDKLRETSTYGADPSSLGEFCLDLINSLEPVKNKIRQMLNTQWQPSACGDKPAKLDVFNHDLIKRQEQVENEIRNINTRFDSIETRVQFLETCRRQQAASDHYKMQETNSPDPLYQEGHRSYQEALPGEVTQKELDKTEECKKLKEKIKELEEKNSKLLSKVMSLHKNSENMNDPFCLSAVLKMYEMLRLQEWEKFRRVSSLAYNSGSKIIKKLFDACEKDIQQRITKIFGALDIPPSNYTMTNSKQEVVQEIRNLFRYSYNQNDSKIYHNIVAEAGVHLKSGTQNQFALQCCKVYCFLLLQDPQVRAVWNIHEMQCLEHVDKKDSEHWEKPALLWPVMKCGEQIIVKGVVWDEK